MIAFADRFPALFHVTERAAMPSIRTHGLLSARRICELHGALDSPLLRANRTAWAEIGPCSLRRQCMSDRTLSTRLEPPLTPEDWRWFINGLVFLFPTERAAARLLSSEPGRDQVVLRYRTAALLEAHTLLTCRHNNGYADRTPAGPGRRLRKIADYTPVNHWDGGRVAEIIAEGHIAAAIEFTVSASP